jgi:quercetin dioxygenase-like cupin family protein
MHSRVRILAASIVTLAAAGSSAQTTSGPATVTVQPVLVQELPDLLGKEVLMLTVEYPPGGASDVHRHNADVFVYVLEGSVVMQVAGGKEVTLNRGETFFESPTDIHRVSRNASSTQPAKFLVFMVKDQGTPATLPVR